MAVVVLLGVLGLAGGIGITAIGPGGVLPTVGLFALTGLSPAQIAGTALVTHVATGALGALAFVRSGQLRHGRALRDAGLLAGAAVVGAPLGVGINTVISARMFGILLGVFVAVVAAIVLYRQRHARSAERGRPAAALVIGLGLLVSTVAGVVGIGGPMLSVPLLVAAGSPVLEALAVAQVQSIVIAGTGSVGYLLHGAIDWRLAAVIGIPELAGVLIGWRLAQVLPTKKLTYALVVALFALAPYLALHG